MQLNVYCTEDIKDTLVYKQWHSQSWQMYKYTPKVNYCYRQSASDRSYVYQQSAVDV